MKKLKLLFIAIFPIVLIIYSIYLMANDDTMGLSGAIGAVFLVMAIVSLIIGSIIGFIFRKNKVFEKWYFWLGVSLASVIITFIILVLYVRLNVAAWS